jgi:glycerate kinase
MRLKQKFMFKKIVVASDSFKGSLTSLQVADAVEQAVLHVSPSTVVVKVDVADGGEGTMDALCNTLGGRKIYVEVSDPLGRPITAPYVILDDGNTAVVEMATASGLPLLSVDERNPLRTSTYGTGQLIADALERGCRKFLVGIGGSATNDAGMGMLEALGYKFLDKRGNVLPGCGVALSEVFSVDASSAMPSLAESEFIVACDVDSPFYGPEGAACVFAPQKGADPQMVQILDQGLVSFAEAIRRFNGKDVSFIPGAGAAGGLGGGFVAFLNAKLESGAQMVLDAIGFDALIQGADMIITGEGRVDFQTLTGKAPFGIARRAHKQGIPVIVIGGIVRISKEDAGEAGFDDVYQVTPADMPLQEAMKQDVASENVYRTTLKMLGYDVPVADDL